MSGQLEEAPEIIDNCIDEECGFPIYMDDGFCRWCGCCQW